MALKLNKTLNKGIVAAECYAKILEIRYYKNNDLEEAGIKITVGFYYSEDARAGNDRDYIDINEYIISDTTVETRAAQYAYLKTLDDFSGATDI